MSYRREPRISNDTWILVADRAHAVVYHSIWPELAKLEPVQSLNHPEGSAHRDDVLTDRPGRFAAPGVPMQSGEPQTDFRHRTANDFAVELVDRLEQGRNNNEFGRLIVVAPPLFLGVLRDRYSAPLAKTIVLELDKELAEASTPEIADHVRQHLAEAVATT
ncbi:Protein required for attachment to host cells [Planctomicrobium piriforme]|uniref:Protein required for attachment to host cells n=2 Tax=Planctomicrobium piriforme TaxID=1576369 RepID=A0A1I3NRN1_9PLAN|nr:Protein required for attachment to host cells [Planctomicrobium piriforme]